MSNYKYYCIIAEYKFIWNIFVHKKCDLLMNVFLIVLAFYVWVCLVFDDEGTSHNLSILASG